MNRNDLPREAFFETDLDKLLQIWERKKEYIEKDLWVIRNFLTDEELEWLNKEANDPIGWYDTMRSPYGGNTKNKFLGYIPEYNADGSMLVPNAQSKWKDRGPVNYIEKRIEAVVPKYFGGAGALQSFFEVPDEQIFQETGRKDIDYAMGWHYERDDSDSEDQQTVIVENSKTQGKRISSEGKISASFNVYINDNFDGGILEFMYKDYAIKPEVGMLVNIPLYKEFMHRVTKVTNGNRHTIYGRCWDTPTGKYLSTNEDC